MTSDECTALRLTLPVDPNPSIFFARTLSTRSAPRTTSSTRTSMRASTATKMAKTATATAHRWPSASRRRRRPLGAPLPPRRLVHRRSPQISPRGHRHRHPSPGVALQNRSRSARALARRAIARASSAVLLFLIRLTSPRALCRRRRHRAVVWSFVIARIAPIHCAFMHSFMHSFTHSSLAHMI